LYLRAVVPDVVALNDARRKKRGCHEKHVTCLWAHLIPSKLHLSSTKRQICDPSRFLSSKLALSPRDLRRSHPNDTAMTANEATVTALWDDH
jgi:hypothetical protein